jgi:hypothetical protein
MKIIVSSLLFIIISIIIYSIIFLIPSGRDVQNAIILRRKIHSFLVTSGYKIEGDAHIRENVVMMKEKKGKLTVIIANPKPDAEILYKIIDNNKTKIGANNFELIFLDGSMKEIKHFSVSGK